MKKKLSILFIVLLTFCMFFSYSSFTFATVVEVSGGRKIITFETEDEEMFELYTEFDRLPYILDGKLYMWSLAEQKAIYKNCNFSDVEVEVDIGTINKNGKIDSGIIVQASNVTGVLDGLTGWCINLENGSGKKYIKLHKWINAEYIGHIVEKPVETLRQVNHLKVTVKNGILYAYLNYSEQEEFSYNIGTTAGSVGLRCCYAPNYFDNFSITGTVFSPDKKNLTDLMERVSEIQMDLLTDSSKNALTEAINVCNSALTSVEQTVVDNAYAQLKTAYENICYNHTYEQLSLLIEKARAITNGGIYTQNSFNAMTVVLGRCLAVTETSSQDEISYWYKRLELRINTLITYLT